MGTQYQTGIRSTPTRGRDGRTGLGDQLFTTGQIAKICRVAPRTVSQWFDKGLLQGYRLAGSQDSLSATGQPIGRDRRVPRENLIRFLKEHGMPLGELARACSCHVLAVGLSQGLYRTLQDELPDPEQFRWHAAATAFEAGLLVEREQPDALVIDLAMGRGECLAMAKHLRAEERLAEVLIIALASEDEPEVELVTHIFSAVFQRPFDSALLVERLRAASNGHAGGGLPA